jgi:membrane associated rhomboid family serine protease
MLYRFKNPKWTYIFFSISLVLFFLQILEITIVVGKENISMIDLLAFIPAYIFSRPWTLITSIFMHANFSHLFWNMFALLTFGSFLESRISTFNFLKIFFISGIVGNLAYFIISPFATIPAVGMSGSLYGLLGAVTYLFPTMIVFLYFIPMPMFLLGLIWFGISLLGTISSILFPTTGGIAHHAHLAGLVVGFLYARRIKRRRRFFWEYY